MRTGLGIDLVSVAEVERTLAVFGDRYLQRTYSASELSDAAGRAARAEFLAGRFAAKEAVWKALGRSSGTPLRWTDIIIARDADRGPVVRLCGWLAGAPEPALSISHEGAYAVACALVLAPPHEGPDSSTPRQMLGTNTRRKPMHESTIIEVLDKHARLARPAGQLAPTDDLYDAGMTSHASVAVMLGLEDAFDIEFPDESLTRDTFRSITAIDTAVAALA